jgi:hypothetical protein
LTAVKPPKWLRRWQKGQSIKRNAVGDTIALQLGIKVIPASVQDRDHNLFLLLRNINNPAKLRKASAGPRHAPKCVGDRYL